MDDNEAYVKNNDPFKSVMIVIFIVLCILSIVGYAADVGIARAKAEVEIKKLEHEKWLLEKGFIKETNGSKTNK